MPPYAQNNDVLYTMPLYAHRDAFIYLHTTLPYIQITATPYAYKDAFHISA